MLNRFIVIIIAFVLFFVESVILSQFAWNGVTLPLTFAFGLCVAVAGDEWNAIILGLVSGLFADLYSNHLFGLSLLLNMYLFLGVNFGKKYLRHDKNWLMAVVMALAAFLRYALHYLINRVTGLEGSFLPVPILALMVGLLAMVLLPLTRRRLSAKTRRVR